MPSRTDDRTSANVTLAPAAAEDALLTFGWRNDPAVRNHSYDSRALTLSGHQAWWAAALRASDRRIFMAMDHGVPIGVLRLDLQTTSAEVSIYLDPTQTGRGLGRRVLQAGIDHARDLGLATLTASIKDDNIASQSAFIAAGFERDGDHWICRVT